MLWEVAETSGQCPRFSHTGISFSPLEDVELDMSWFSLWMPPRIGASALQQTC